MTSATPAIGPGSRLLLVDGHSLAYRAFYAVPLESFSAPDGRATNAVHGFLSMLLKVVEGQQPTHLAVAFDVSRDTFRRAEFADYKANRAKSPPEFSPQVEVIKRALDALNIANLAQDGFEADDIIATLAKSAEAQDAEVLILTGDRDTLQLVSDDINVLYPIKGVGDLARFTPAAVFEKYGVTPRQYADLAALRGDTSDNLPSIPGVGEKTAAKWLNEYGDLTNLVANAADIKGKVGEALREHVSQVLLNRRLTQLVSDVPLHLQVHELERRPADRSLVLSLFDELGFKALKDRVLRVFADASELPEAKPAAERHMVAWKPGELALSLAELGTASRAALAVVSSSDGHPVALGIADSKVVLEIDMSAAQASDERTLHSFLGDPSRNVVVHSVKPIEKWAKAQGFSAAAVKVDTELLQYLLNSSLRSLDLDSVYERWLARPLPASPEPDLFGSAAEGLGQRAAAVLDLAEAMLVNADSETIHLHDNLELPLARLLAEMEVTGIAVSVEALEALDAAFEAQILAAESQAHAAAGRSFNLGSPKQLQELLFEERKLPKTKKIKTGYTTDAAALQWLLEETADPVVAQILDWREVTKLRQTVAGLLKLVDSNGRVHTTFQQTVAATGRLSSADPNLQNIPVRTEAGRLIRKAFVVGSGYQKLMTADYSQIEMRIMAHLSADEGLIAAFNSGEDLHTTVASEVFEVEPAAVTPDMRRRIKAMSYGLVYGLSAYGLSQQLGIETREAAALMERYFERFGGVQRYLREIVDEATRNGYTETMLGRRRYFPELASEGPARAAGERMALNAPIQGTAADIIKQAMLDVEAGLRAAGLRSRLLLQVHDELVLEVAPGEADEVERIVRSGMGAAAHLKVPLEVSVGFGQNWDDAAH